LTKKQIPPGVLPCLRLAAVAHFLFRYSEQHVRWLQEQVCIPSTLFIQPFHLASKHVQLRSREDENTNLKGHLLVLSAELQKRDGGMQSLGRSPSYPPPTHSSHREPGVSPATSHPNLSQQNSQGSARGTPVSFSRSTPDHSVDFSSSELLARVASMQQQLVESQVASLRDRCWHDHLAQHEVLL
jgi:hypothetical protein